MGNIGTTELIIIALLLLVFFGAKRIPDLARGIGKGIRVFRREIRDSPGDGRERTEGIQPGEERRTQS